MFAQSAHILALTRSTRSLNVRLFAVRSCALGIGIFDVWSRVGLQLKVKVFLCANEMSGVYSRLRYNVRSA